MQIANEITQGQNEATTTTRDQIKAVLWLLFVFNQAGAGTLVNDHGTKILGGFDMITITN